MNDKLKDALLKIFIDQVKSHCSCEDKDDLRCVFDKLGYTGIFTDLDQFYECPWDLQQDILDNWNV